MWLETKHISTISNHIQQYPNHIPTPNNIPTIISNHTLGGASGTVVPNAPPSLRSLVQFPLFCSRTRDVFRIVNQG